MSGSRRASRWASPAAQQAQASLRRMREFGIRPDRDLGQNFLVDSNILGVIERAAQLSADDVVLEIGGGLGVLSEHLAERVAHVHVVEIDERLREALLDATASARERHGPLGRRDDDRPRPLSPAPDKVVANLPYGIAAGALLRTIEELPTLERWVVMVQREVGERLAASPAAPARAPTGRRRCSRSSAARSRSCARSRAPCSCRCPTSTPCSSACAGGAPAAPTTPALRGLVGGGFAHRRKTLAGSLAPVGGRAGALARGGAGGAAAHRTRARRARRAALAGGFSRARANAGAVSAHRALAPGQGQPRPVRRVPCATRTAGTSSSA